MPKASPIRSSFNAGELSPLLDGRVDIAKYNNGCRSIENFIPAVQGPAVRRGGTRYVNDVYITGARAWLMPFQFNTQQAFVLEFGAYYIRFYTDHGILLTSGVASYSLSTAYVIGDLVKYNGFVYYAVQNSTGVVPGSSAYWFLQAAYPGYDSIYEIPSPYGASDLTAADDTFALDFVQSGDVIYITHGSFPVQKLQRYGNTRWILQEVAFTNGPFKDQNVDQAITVTPSADIGTITLTASSAIFEADHVGSYFYLEPSDLSNIKPWTAGQEWTTAPLNAVRRSDGKIYICTTAGAPSTSKVWRTGPDKPIHNYGTEIDGGGQAIHGTVVEREGLDWTYLTKGYGYVLITGFTSPTVVTAVVQGNDILPSVAPTFRWAHGAFSDAEGFPTNVTFFRERLTFGKNQTLYFSVTGDFENFGAVNESGEVVADRAITVTLSTDQPQPIQWMVPSQALLIGTAGSEFACHENTTNEVFAPGNVKIEQQTSDGSNGCFPALVGYSTLFVQRSGRKLKEAAYNFQQNGYVTSDLTVLSEHITVGGVQQLAWHKEPYACLWAVRGDGVLLGFTFNKEQEVVCWHRHPMTNGIVESVCVIPSPDGTRDDLWLIVKRNIEGDDVRYVEYLEREYLTGDDQDSCFYVDCGLTYDGSPTTTISGLDHLEGQTVQVLADGAAHPDRVVTGGEIELQLSASVVQVGLPFDSVLQTNRLEAGAGDGTAQGKTKRINKCVFRFMNTLGAQVGPDENTLDEIEFRNPNDPMNQPPPIFTGDKLMEWPDGYNFDGYIMVVQDQPLPMTVVAIMPQVHTFDR